MNPTGIWEYWEAAILPVVDFDGNGDVDVKDLAILSDGWGKNEHLCDIGPFAWGDGIVDEQDLAVLAEYMDVSGPVVGHAPLSYEPEAPRDTILSWTPRDPTENYDVYFGTSFENVNIAERANPLDVLMSQGQDANIYIPTELLEFSQSYYWRIDTVTGSSNPTIYRGFVWSFMVRNFFAIDDFEDYDIGNKEIWWSWKDGLGYVAHDNEPAYPGNGTGAEVGDENSPSYMEETIIHGGDKSMPVVYNNNKNGFLYYSEVEHTLTDQRDWTKEGIVELSLWFRGLPGSTGSFVEGPVGTYTMTGSGTDIWDNADEFHFAFKELTGIGSIVAKVENIENTDPWAKAGVMIRETLEPGSKFAAVYITPGQGCRLQTRTDTNIDATSDTSVSTAEQRAITTPYWIKLDRDLAGNFRGYYSSDGTNWQQMVLRPNIFMDSIVYIGLALTAHNAEAVCEAKFSNVTIAGAVDPHWSNQDIGILGNDQEPLYVAVSNNTGTSAIVVHNDPAAATIDTWSEWVIPLQMFADQGIDLTDVDNISIGLGTKGNSTIPGGSGKMYFDDIRLYRQRINP